MKTVFLGAGILMATATFVSAVNDIGPNYWVLKKRDYDQTSTADPTMTSSVPFQFDSLVEKATGGNLTSGTITPPGSGIINTPQAYTLQSDGSLDYTGYFSSQANVNTAFGSGGYIITVIAPGNDHTVTLSLSGDHYSSVVPKVSNPGFNRGELVLDATTSNTLNWNSFSDRAQVDLILVTIYESDTPVLRRFLPATANSLTLDPNFLQPEKVYSMELSFVKIVDKNVASIPNAVGYAGYAVTDRVVLTTTTRTPLSGLGNISTRGLVGTGDNVMIAGFIITNTDTTSTLRVAVRGIGPSLHNAGVTDPLLDPVLFLYDNQGHVIASNDDWATGPDAQEIQDLGLKPTDSRESALLEVLGPGQYTAIVRGKDNTTGVALAEVYNLGSFGDSDLANISTRGQVGTGDDVLIGGVIISGAFSHQVIVRALGPSLTASGVPGALADPVLVLNNAQGIEVARNDDWKDTQQTEIEATGIPPTNDKESAIVQTLAPGNYTAIVKGRSMTTGVGLVEVYKLN